jgi:tRNA-(ms[2]io[6]A)-hydroxylase
MPTDPRWANVAEDNLSEILSDHAFCEQKAASSAISLIILYPELTDLVQEMSSIAIEEMEHFRAVHQKIIERGYTLGKERKDDYVNKLMEYFPKTSDKTLRLVQRLLFAAMIEARSCERFHVLSQNVNDKELEKFYHDLEQSEARHYATFINFAKKYGGKIEVESMWQEFLKFEAELIQSFGKESMIHG